MNTIDLSFGLIGSELPVDNGYLLYSAICSALGGHLPEGVGVSSIGGFYLGDGLVSISKINRLRIRTPLERIPELLNLAGRFLDIGGYEIRLGVPSIQALAPAPKLISRIVTIKGFEEPDPFLEAVGRKLDELEVHAHAYIPLVKMGERKGRPMRRIVRIKNRKIIGFTVVLDGLSDSHSLNVQELGLGGRRHMGCGIFLPVKTRKGSNDGL